MNRLLPLLGISLLGMMSTTSITVFDCHAQSDPETAVVTVNMVDNGGGQWRFEPASVVVSRGMVLRFVQKDIAPHNVEIKDAPDKADIDDVLMGPFLTRKGQTYDIAIDDRFVDGEYEYVCTPHAAIGMKAEFTVEPSNKPSTTN